MKRIIIGTAVVILLVLVGWYEGFYRSEVSHISALKAKQVTAEAAVMSATARYSSLLASEKHLPAERVALSKLNALLPYNPEEDMLEKILFAAATRAGVKISVVATPVPNSFSATQSASPSPTSGPSTININLSVTGTEAKVIKLYDTLVSDNRLFVIDNCVLDIRAFSHHATAARATMTSGTINVRAFFGSTAPISAAS